MGTLVSRPSNTDSVVLWTRRITECKNSGIPTTKWCSENGINIKTYYYWHNKLHKIVQQQECFYEVPVTYESRQSPAATIRVGIVQADIYSGADIGVIQAICQAMKSC